MESAAVAWTRVQGFGAPASGSVKQPEVTGTVPATSSELRPWRTEC